MEKTHWKKTIDPNFIGTYILPDDKPINVTISSVVWQNAKVMGQNQKKVIAYFAPNKYFDKPMLLNATNMQRLEVITGTKYIEDWKDVYVTLQREMDKCIGGGRDWALRIAPIAPKTAATPKQKLLPTSPNWTQIVKWVADGGDINGVKKKYDITDENFKKLTDASRVRPKADSEG